MLRDNSGLAENLGKAFKAVMDNLLYGFTLVYDISRVFWWKMDEALFSKIPDGMKSWVGDWVAIGVAVLIAASLFRGLYSTLKMIFGLGSLAKSLGLDGAKGGKTSKMASAFGKIPLVAQTLAFSASVAGPINDMLRENIPGYSDMDNKFTSFLTDPFSSPQIRSDMRPSLRVNPTQPPRSDYVTKDNALTVDVNVNNDGLKDFINVQIKDEQQKILNQIYPQQ
jgi:hypothetical protein